MDLTKRELENRLNAANNATSKESQRLKTQQNSSLQDFVDKASDLVSKLRNDTDNAQSAFKDVVEYFGEDTKTTDCNTFFGYLVRFIATWRNAEEENLKKARQLQLQQIQQKSENKKSEKEQKSAVINELKTRNNRFRSKPEPNEFQDGTFEDIILGMKSEPYRTNINEGMRKSFRKRGDPMSMSTSETEPL